MTITENKSMFKTYLFDIGANQRCNIYVMKHNLKFVKKNNVIMSLT